KASPNSKVTSHTTKSDTINKQTTFNQQARTSEQSGSPPQSLRPLRQTIRTNHAFDLQTAARLHNP
ncbi:unnamed protein product, partial [Rotaria sordida]